MLKYIDKEYRETIGIGPQAGLAERIGVHGPGTVDSLLWEAG